MQVLFLANLLNLEPESVSIWTPCKLTNFLSILPIVFLKLEKYDVNPKCLRGKNGYYPDSNYPTIVHRNLTPREWQAVLDW